MSMELDNSFTVPVPPDVAWDVLLDVARIAPCMPGATVDEVDGDVVTGRIKVKLGPVSLTYRGTAKFNERDEAAHTILVEASGKETRGAGTAAATIKASLEPADAGATLVNMHTSMNVTGRPAQFGRGVMVEVSAKLIDQFASNLAQQLAADTSTPTADTSAPAADAAKASVADGATAGGATADGPVADGATADRATADRATADGAAADGPAAVGQSARDNGSATVASDSATAASTAAPAATNATAGTPAAAATPTETTGTTPAEPSGTTGTTPAEPSETTGTTPPEPSGTTGTTPAETTDTATAMPTTAAPTAATPAPARQDSINIIRLVGPAILKRVLPVAAAATAAALIGRKLLRTFRRAAKH